jgi:uncharacterized Zn-binding protein involved in type VI secretion
MPGVAVGSLDAAGGVQSVQANAWFRIEGRSIVVVGDLVAGHGNPPHSPPPAMVTGTLWFKVGARAVCRAGDIAACGHATSGRTWFKVS